MKFRTTSTEMISPKVKSAETSSPNAAIISGADVWNSPVSEAQNVAPENSIATSPNIPNETKASPNLPNGAASTPKPEPIKVMPKLDFPSMPVSPQTVKQVDSPTLGVDGAETPKASDATPISPISARTSFENRRASLKQKRASMDHRSSLDQRVISAELQARLTVHEKQMRSFGEEFPADLIIPAEYLPKLPTNPRRDITPTQADFPAKKSLWLDTSQTTSYDAPVSPDYAVKPSEEKPEDKHLSSLSFIRFGDAPSDLVLQTPITPAQSDKSDALSQVVSAESRKSGEVISESGSRSRHSSQQLDSPTVPVETFRIQVSPPKRQSLQLVPEPFTPSTAIESKRKQRASLLGNLGLGMKPQHKRAATDMAAYEPDKVEEPISKEPPKAEIPQRAVTVLPLPEKGKKRRFSGLSSLISRASPRRQSSSNKAAPAPTFATQLESTPEHPQPAQFEKSQRPFFPPRKSSRELLQIHEKTGNQQPQMQGRSEPSSARRDATQVVDAQGNQARKTGRRNRQSHDGHPDARRNRRQSHDAGQPEIDYKSVYPPEFYATDPVEGYYSPTEDPRSDEALTAYATQAKGNTRDSIQFPKPPSTVPTRNQLDMHPKTQKASIVQIPSRQQASRQVSEEAPPPPPPKDPPRASQQSQYEARLKSRQKVSTITTTTTTTTRHGARLSQGSVQSPKSIRSQNRASLPPLQTKMDLGLGPVSRSAVPTVVMGQNKTVHAPTVTTTTKSKDSEMTVEQPVVESKPVKAPEPVRAPEPMREPEHVRAPELVRAPASLRTSEPVKAPEPVRALEPVRASAPIRAPEPVRTPEPVRAPKEEVMPETVEAVEPVYVENQPRKPVAADQHIKPEPQPTEETASAKKTEPKVREPVKNEAVKEVEPAKPDKAAESKLVRPEEPTAERAPSPVEKMKDEPRAAEEQKEDESDEEIVMSSTAYPGQEWRPDYGYGGWEGD